MATAGARVAEMSLNEVATLLNVSRYTIPRLADLHTTRVDGLWRIAPRDLARFINTNTVTPEGQVPNPVTADAIPRARTLEEAAQESGLPLGWLKKACATRLIPHLRPGRAYRMLPAQIEAAQQYAAQISGDDAELAADRAAYASGRRSPRRRAA